jgi:hypothetical protein
MRAFAFLQDETSQSVKFAKWIDPFAAYATESYFTSSHEFILYVKFSGPHCGPGTEIATTKAVTKSIQPTERQVYG